MSKFLYVLECDDWITLYSFISSEFKNQRIISAETVNENKSKYFMKSFLDKSKNVYLIKNQKDLNDNVDNLEKMISGDYQNKHVIVYVIDSVDKRSKLYKKHNKLIQSLTLSPPKLCEMLNISVSSQLLNQLFFNCGNSISNLYFELTKIKSLSEKRNIGFDESAKLVLDSMIVSTEIDTFAYIDTLISLDKSRLLGYIELVDTSTFDFGFCSLIYDAFHKLYVVKEAGIKATPELTGLSTFIINKYRDLSNRYSLVELENILSMISEIDKGVKCGNISTDYAYDLLLVRLLSCKK